MYGSVEENASYICFLFLNLFQVNESIVAKTTITMPVNGGPIEAVSTIETVPHWTRSQKSENLLFVFPSPL